MARRQLQLQLQLQRTMASKLRLVDVDGDEVVTAAVTVVVVVVVAMTPAIFNGTMGSDALAEPLRASTVTLDDDLGQVRPSVL